MGFLKTPFSLGSLKLESNIFYAPLAGCTDFPVRKIASRYRPGLQFCEMVKMDALVRQDSSTYRLLDYTADMHPIGAQLCGSKPKIAAQAARMIEDLGFDVLDLNCGCPVDKVTKDNSGSGLLRHPELIGEILSEIRAVIDIPVTLKIRAGWDSLSINGPEITKIAEKAGAAAIAVHGRTRAQAYKGAANWEYIRQCKEAANQILVIGNGDLISGESACKMFSQTGCDGILVARGMLGRPWIVEDMMDALLEKKERKRSCEMIRDLLIEHLQIAAFSQASRLALLHMRRVACWYLKPYSLAKELRLQINSASTLEELRHIIEGYPWNVLSQPHLIEA